MLLVANCGWSWLAVLAIITLVVAVLDDTVILASFR